MTLNNKVSAESTLQPIAFSKTVSVLPSSDILSESLSFQQECHTWSIYCSLIPLYSSMCSLKPKWNYGDQMNVVLRKTSQLPHMYCAYHSEINFKLVKTPNSVIRSQRSWHKFKNYILIIFWMCKSMAQRWEEMTKHTDDLEDRQ